MRDVVEDLRIYGEALERHLADREPTDLPRPASVPPMIAVPPPAPVRPGRAGRRQLVAAAVVAGLIVAGGLAWRGQNAPESVRVGDGPGPAGSAPVTPTVASPTTAVGPTTPSTAAGPGPGDQAVMPDLRGSDLNVIFEDHGDPHFDGRGDGVLNLLHRQLGAQITISRASDLPDGVIIDQQPAPGTPLAGRQPWTLTVSAGGPPVAFADLPPDVAAFALTLPGFDREEPLLVRTRPEGTVYKTDRWLFGLSCSAVEAAYRTFNDGRYDTSCPEAIEDTAGE